MTARRETRRNRNEEGSAQTTDELQDEVVARAESDADQTAADLDQTQADSDQTASDFDQLASDADQALANREQHASERDQAASDLDRSHAHGPELEQAFETSRIERLGARQERISTALTRARTTAERLATAGLRDESARVRDLIAAARDRAARARDEAAAARDRAAAGRERHAVEAGDINDALVMLRTLRVSSASVREQAALERIAAATDREAAAADREQAAAERHAAGLDELTGVLRRGTGELALTHEIDRSRRLDRSLVVAVIDVDALKAVNDKDGHAAGDALLRDVPTAITSTLRSYDVTVRWGGDEFVCAMSSLTLEAASNRVGEIQRVLETLQPGASISVGLAQLCDSDTLESLIARADAALYAAKTNRDS